MGKIYVVGIFVFVCVSIIRSSLFVVFNVMFPRMYIKFCIKWDITHMEINGFNLVTVA